MFKLLKRISKRELLLIVPVIIFVVIQVYLDLELPDYISEMTKILQTPGSKVEDIFEPGFKMLLCALGSFVSAIITGYFVAYIAASFSQRQRKDVFYKVEDFSMAEIKKFSVSSLIVRTNNDILNIQRFVAMGLQVIIKAPILSIWAVSKIAGKSLTWSAYTGIAVLVLLVLITTIVILVLPKTKIIQKLTDKLNAITRENITGIRVIKAFNASSFQKEKFEVSNDDVTNTNIFINKAMSIMMPFMSLIMSSLSLVIYLTGAYIINDALIPDKLTLFSDMIVFSSYAVQVIMAFMMLVIIIIIYPRASVSAKRVLEVIKTDTSIKSGKYKDNKNNGEIEFVDVSFKYPDAEESVLENISFKAKKGETIAFIGGTASGKSSLVNLIPRFYDVTSGQILINGINVKEYELENLYSKFGYVPQSSVIFKGTVKSNVDYGSSEVSEDDIVKALDVAQATNFVQNMEKGIDASLASRGTNISGGQKQRVSIARAVALKPEFYIFDDSFSALDYKTDSVLRRALKKYTKDTTTLIVGQRVGTIMNADKIIVLDEGKVVGIGTHNELLKSCEIYKEIALSQLSEEELNHE